MITLLGNPQSTNSVYKYHCKFGFPKGYLSKEGSDLRESYQWQARSQWKKKPTEKEVAIDIRLMFRSHVRHDIDNYGKILLDALTGIVWEDDSQIQSMSVSKWMDKENPRIEVVVNELN